MLITGQIEEDKIKLRDPGIFLLVSQKWRLFNVMSLGKFK